MKLLKICQAVIAGAILLGASACVDSIKDEEASVTKMETCDIYMNVEWNITTWQEADKLHHKLSKKLEQGKLPFLVALEFPSYPESQYSARVNSSCDDITEEQLNELEKLYRSTGEIVIFDFKSR